MVLRFKHTSAPMGARESAMSTLLISDLTLAGCEVLNMEVNGDVFSILDDMREYPVGCTDEELLEGTGALFSDVSPNLWSKEEWTDHPLFNSLCDTQVRVRKGLEVINAATKERQSSYDTYACLRDRCREAVRVLEDYKATSGGSASDWAHWDLFNDLRSRRNDAWGWFEGTRDEVRKYWTYWNKLKSGSDSLIEVICNDQEIETSDFWGKCWFAHMNEIISPYSTRGNNGDFDEQVHLVVDSSRTYLEVYRGLSILSTTIPLVQVRRLEGEYEGLNADNMQYNAPEATNSPCELWKLWQWKVDQGIIKDGGEQPFPTPKDVNVSYEAIQWLLEENANTSETTICSA